VERKREATRPAGASFAVANGASLFQVGKALGHTQATTTERYAHLADDPVRAVAESVAREILGVQAPLKQAGS